MRQTAPESLSSVELERRFPYPGPALLSLWPRVKYEFGRNSKRADNLRVEDPMKTLRYALGALLITCLLFTNAYASSFTGIVVLGDSLSDNGNLYAAIHYPPSPYYGGRFSNGPVAVEYLSQRLGLSLADYAWGGATTGVGNVNDGGTVDALGPAGLPGIKTVFQSVFPATPIDPDALYIVWGGPNDFWFVTTPAEAAVAIGKAVTNLVTMAGALRALGAKNVLVANMPDLGKTPAALAGGAQASFFFTQISLGFNQALKENLPPGVHYFDTYSVLTNIIRNPNRYGFTNITDPLINAPPGADPAQYLFFDNVHPTTAGHQILADAFYQSVAPTVIIGECNSGAPNPLFSSGSTVWDLIEQVATNARNHGQFVSGVDSITNELKKSEIYSGSQKAAIQSCAAKADIP